MFDYNADIVECPDYIANNLEEYCDKFLKWLFDKQNEHSYWMYKDGEKFGCCYRSDAFVEWLNNFILFDSLVKSKVIEKCVDKWNKKLPKVYF